MYIVVCMVHMLFIFVYIGQKPTRACVVLLFKMPTINKTYLILSYLRHLALYHYKKKHSILSIIHGHIFTTDFMGSFKPQALEFQTPHFPHLVPPAIMVWILVWKYIFESFIHILQHCVLQLSRSTNFCF